MYESFKESIDQWYSLWSGETDTVTDYGIGYRAVTIIPAREIVYTQSLMIFPVLF